MRSATRREIRYSRGSQSFDERPYAALIDRDRAVAGVGERRKLMAPGVPELREAMHEKNERSASLLGDVDPDAARDDSRVSDRCHRRLGLLAWASGCKRQRAPEVRCGWSTWALCDRRIQQRNRMLVSNFMLLPILAATAGCIALVPRRLALLFAERFELRLLEAPVRFPPLRLRMIWSRTADSDPGHRWFREALVTAVGENRSESS